MKKITLLGLLVAFISLTSKAQVPPQWDTAQTQLTLKLNQINTAIQNKWDNQPYCTNFASNLMLANSNRGYELFTPNPATFPYPAPAYQNALYAKIDTMLMAFDTIGLKAVDLTVQYPMLVNSFNKSQYYLDFYKTVVQKIKQKGFKLIIGCQAAFVDSAFGNPYMVADITKHYFNPDNNSLTNDTLNITRYKIEKLQMMQTIIDSLAPDYLTLEMEPQTQEVNLFHLIDYSVDSTISMINYFTNNLNTSITEIGAGAGTWDDMTFYEEVATTNIDYIDYHIYPPHFDYINNRAFLIDSIADVNNKKLIIGESWCYKATDFEMTDITDPVATSSYVYSRDFFNNWENIDTLFIKSMIQLSQQSKVELVQFHWFSSMFGQMTYDASTHSTMSPSQIINLGAQIGYANMFQFNLSPVGVYTQLAIANICTTTGIEEQNTTNNLSVFPNPANSVINIDTDRNIKSISIYDMTGKAVASFQNTNQSFITLPSYLTNGLYLLRIDTEGGIINKKILIYK